ncbi:MAG: hypothetical protein A2W18_02735 [Candidatus Muproteobacteria bacterium RBG_16_60_9]|uniref:Uncharacterized protein n=1 Tax=Candidatus Muproteobacteria bacterium RBG_16_60_9 TaxID=1817755 RepID=A0A1F6UZA6_9PROT|nr:MAG: hypothetical protein A2W18_02735 [Candidatus Muproteobacteria bacterium RBG_16_60_9]
MEARSAEIREFFVDFLDSATLHPGYIVFGKIFVDCTLGIVATQFDPQGGYRDLLNRISEVKP